jgi:ATP-dependent Lon protease
MDPAAQAPASTTPANTVPSSQLGGGENGDNSKINGDQIIQNPLSNQVLDQRQAQEATQVSITNRAQVVNNAQQSETQKSVIQAANGEKEATQTTTPNVTVKPQRDQIKELEDSVAGSPMSEELKEIIHERIERLKQIKAGAGYMSSMYILEYESTSRYVNWCVGLPWVQKTKDLLDLTKAKEILNKHHYGLNMLKDRMLEYIASIMLNIQNNGMDFTSRSPILCFVGLAGTGKTTFAFSMAEALGREIERIPFGGMADSRVLRGQSRFFPDAEPGQIIKRLVHAKAKNPVMLLDEIDRVTETARADIMGVLIELLDPEQNSAFADHYIDFPFNLSNCLFVATSNNVSTIATAVLDRMEIIQMPSYNDEEKMVIGRDYVLPKVRQLIGLREDQMTIDDGIWEPIIRPLGYDPGVRGLDRLINMMCRRAARIIVSGEAKSVRITPDNVKKFTQDF